MNPSQCAPNAAYPLFTPNRLQTDSAATYRTPLTQQNQRPPYRNPSDWLGATSAVEPNRTPILKTSEPPDVKSSGRGPDIQTQLSIRLMLPARPTIVSDRHPPPKHKTTRRGRIFGAAPLVHDTTGILPPQSHPGFCCKVARMAMRK